MIRRDDRIEDWYASLADGGCQMRADKDVIQSFGSSGIGRNIVMCMTVGDAIHKIVFDKNTIQTIMVVSNGLIEVTSKNNGVT